MYKLKHLMSNILSETELSWPLVILLIKYAPRKSALRVSLDDSRLIVQQKLHETDELIMSRYFDTY